MNVEQGPDMPSEEFAELLARQPVLESRWDRPMMGEQVGTVEWKDLADFQKQKLFDKEKARGLRAEAQLRQVRALADRQFRWGGTYRAELRRILGLVD